MIGSIIGLVTLLLALVLGLLVWTSYGVYANQNTESRSLGPPDPEARLRSRAIRAGSQSRTRFAAGGGRARTRSFLGAGREQRIALCAQLRADLHEITSFFAGLEPATDQQKQIITTAMPDFMEVVERTVLMTRQLANPARNPRPSHGHRVVGLVVRELRIARRLQRPRRRRRGAGVDRGRERDFHDSPNSANPIRACSAFLL